MNTSTPVQAETLRPTTYYSRPQFPSSELAHDSAFSPLKILRKDLSRHRATDLGRSGIHAMETFMDRHSVA
jgi:hypothetical protein